MAADTPNLPPADNGRPRKVSPSDRPRKVPPRGRPRKVSPRGRLPVLWALAGLGLASVMTQLALMRELLCAFAGNEMVLGIALGLWLLLTGMGTSLGRTADKLRNPLAVLFTAQIFIAIVPLMQVFAIRALRNVVFVRGAEVGVTGTVLSAAVLLLPFCIVAGYTLTLACSILMHIPNTADTFGVPPSGGSVVEGTQDTEMLNTQLLEGETPNQAAGRVYVADSLGSVAGGALFSFVLVRFLDHIALLAVPALLNLAAAAWLGRAGERASSISPANPLRRGIFILTLVAGIAAFVWLVNADALSTSLQFPGQNVLFRANSPYGRLVVTESGGETNFIENGIAVVSTPNVEQVEEAAHYAMVQQPDAPRVLLVSGGVAGVAKEILKYNVAGVDCVELDPLVIETGRRFLPEHFDDSRIHVIATDARQFVRQTTNHYDVVILALPDPSTAQLDRFFTVEFFSGVKRVLADDGVLSFALGRYENYVSPELAQLLASAHRSLQQSFANILVLPGGRVFFLASDGPLHGDIAARVEAQGVPTKLVNRHYLDAMLTADRMADIQRAVSQPAALNRDFSPMLYFYHLRHWMSQFTLELRRAASGAVAVAARVSHSIARTGAGALCVGLRGIGAGGRAAAGLPGFVRLGLSSGRRDRDGLHGWAGGWGSVGESSFCQAVRRGELCEPHKFRASCNSALRNRRVTTRDRQDACPTLLLPCWLRPPASAFAAAAESNGRHNCVVPCDQSRHRAADFDSRRAGRRAVPAGKPLAVRRHGDGRVAALHGGFRGRIPRRAAGEHAVDSAGWRDGRLPADGGVECAGGRRPVLEKGFDMTKLNIVSIKIMRWSGWLLLPLVMLFLLTGYIMDGRYGFSKLLDEKSALTFHRMLHLPLIILVVAHVVPAVYLAMQRWGWIKQRA